MKTAKINFLTQSIAVSLLAFSGQLHAQSNQLEEVIVTAQKREESLQDAPLAISAITADVLETKGIKDFSGLATATPSIYFSQYPTSGNALMLFMRGQGNGDPAQITGDGSVGLYVDGIYIARAQGSTFDIADVERVEVLRGPQGTLYGRNTTGGAVNIITKKPTGEFGFKQQFSYGSRDYFRSLTSIDLPKAGDFAVKVSYLRSSIDAQVRNVGSSHGYGEEEQRAGRVAVQWTPREDVTVDYAFEKGDIWSTPSYYQNDSLVGFIPGYSTSDDRTWRDIDLPIGHASYEGHSLIAAWDINPNFTVKSLTSYRKLNDYAFNDFAESFSDPKGAPYLYYVSADEVAAHQFSQEFQFIGSALDNQIDYVAGLYYFEESASHDRIIGLTGIDLDNYVTADAKSMAAFGQVTWTPQALDDLSITVGARYTKDDRDAVRDKSFNGFPTETGVRNSLSFKRFNPSLTVNYKWTADISTYAKVATGYRAGGSAETAIDFSKTYGPEKVISKELGLKSYWWDHRVRANVAVFSTDYRDMQIAISPDATDHSVTQTINAGRAEINGAELELLVAPIDNLTVNFDYTYTDWKIKKVRVDGADLTGFFSLPFAPEHSYSIGADYKFFTFSNGDLSAHIDYRWMGDAFTSGTSGPAVVNREYFGRNAYGLLNGRVTLAMDLPRGDRARIGIWGKNLADKQYLAHAIANGDYLDPVNGYTSQAYSLGAPRSFGVDLTYEY